MRVLHVLEVSNGGVVTLAQTLVRLQEAAGLDVHVLAQRGVVFDAGTVHRWAPRRRRPASLGRSWRDLRRVVDDVRPEVVHLHSFFAGLLGRIGHLPGRPRVVYQPHSWAFEAVPKFLSPVVARWERHALGRTDITLTNCRDELDEGRRRGVVGGDAVAVGLPVDTQHFRPVDDCRAARGALGLNSPHLIVCVGRLSRQKGQDQLARQWEATPIRGAVLALVGSGDQDLVTDQAPRSSGASLHLVGDCADVRPWLQAADVVVLPSRYEGQSVAMAEAMACGVPVVTTEVNGAWEAVAPQGEVASGAVVALGDMAALLAACACRLEDPARRDAEGRRARDRAVRLFDADTVGARVSAAYAGPLGSSRRTRNPT